MKWNLSEISHLAVMCSEMEGRLNYQLYQPPLKSLGPFRRQTSELKLQYFRLKANFLIYYDIEENKSVSFSKPLGMLVLERFYVQRDSFDDANAFSIYFEDAPGKNLSCSLISKFNYAMFKDLLNCC